MSLEEKFDICLPFYVSLPRLFNNGVGTNHSTFDAVVVGISSSSSSCFGRFVLLDGGPTMHGGDRLVFVVVK